MNTQQNEICISLILSASKRQEVYAVMNQLFKGLNQKDLMNFVSQNWDKHYKNQKICLHRKSYEDVFKIVDGLMFKKESGSVKKIKCRLVSSIEKKIPIDVYNLIIGPHLSKRELLRGLEVEILRFTKDRMKIVIKHESDFYEHDFTIWDIDSRSGLKVIM